MIALSSFYISILINFLCQDGDGVITFDEFVIVSKKFPNILFPAYQSK